MEKEICPQLQEQDKLGPGLRGLFVIIFSFFLSFSWMIPQPQALTAVVLCVHVWLLLDTPPVLSLPFHLWICPCPGPFPPFHESL